jgi:TolB-like protein/DNA-binding winged helix-turn-helix (wHTH) protein/tetratricopeptide (TPR) repeat protein
VNSALHPGPYEFEGFVLDPTQRTLRTAAGGQPLRLSARAFDALCLLVERDGQLVDKETLIKALWPKVVVEENNLTQVIHALRQTLGEKPGQHRFIATVPGRGYQFVAMVKAVPRVSTGNVPAAGSESRARYWRWGAMALAVLALTGTWWALERGEPLRGNSERQATSPAAMSAPRSTVAVLPFVNLTGDVSKDYLGDGMAEELINTLTRVPGLKVPARTSAFSYKGRNVDARRIAAELGVGVIVEGSVRAADQRIRITAQLINAQDGLHLWSASYDEDSTDIFRLQDKLAREIAAALHVMLTGDAAAAVTSRPPTVDTDAYRMYLQGTALLERPALLNVERALEYFQQAIARDAKFARAYEGVTRAQMFRLALRQKPAQAALLAAERAALQALALDANSPSALGNLAIISMRRGKWLAMKSQFQASIALNDNDALSHMRAGGIGHTGHRRQALQEVRKAYELAPSNGFIVGVLAAGYSATGAATDASRYARLAMDLGVPASNWYVSSVAYAEALSARRYLEAGDIHVARAALIRPADTREIEAIRLAYAAMADSNLRAAALKVGSGLRVAAQPAIAGSRATAESVEGKGMCVATAHAYAVFGAMDIAYRIANECIDVGASDPFEATLELWLPALRQFRQDPRFHDYVARLGDLIEYWKQYGPPDECELRNGRLICH